MAIAERIKFFRTLRGITQKELGLKLDYLCENRIAQYESGYRTPKGDTLERLAEALDVVPEAIKVPDIDTVLGVMHTLFALEDMYGLSVFNVQDRTCINLKSTNEQSNLLGKMIKTWAYMKGSLDAGEITKADYDNWRYNLH